MATTVASDSGGEYSDPTFLAYERARQAGEQTLYGNRDWDQGQADEGVQRSALSLAQEQAGSVDKNLADYRSTGFGQSGLRTRDEDRIRADITNRLGTAISGYQNQSHDIANTLAMGLAQDSADREEQAIQARRRIMTDYANSGVGI